MPHLRPVGTHETLLAYLVRRLLENGANTSFVNRIADNTLPLDELVADPVSAVEKLAQQEGQAGLPHPKIPLPRDLYGSGRSNSAGLDLANEHRLASPLPCSTARCINGRHCRCWSSRWPKARCSRWLTRQSRKISSATSAKPATLKCSRR
ncbi:proline dehydrogenase family protein [Klebsiella pneumoniae]|uniref:Proline dehydrogenase family protein n=1 Tax=Klebsiella pneumoniae TaxID=573 RepID=A0A927HVG7_KLEPN|nr:proline dehydrogenase family protein [Klebsiella pneumoniae]